MKPWELDADAPPNPAGDIPPGGLGIDVPVQQGWQVSAADQKIRDEASRRLRATETNQPKPWEMDADAPAEPAAPTALPQAKKQMSPFAQGVVDLSPAKALYGLAETGSQMVTGAAGQAIGGWRGISSLLRGEGLDKAVEKIRGTEDALTYQPHSAQGKQIAQAVAYPFEQFNEGAGKIGESVGGAGGRAIGENILPVAGTVLPAKPMLRQARAAAEAKNQFKFPVRDEATGAVTYYDPEKVGFARENAAKLEAHELARKHGIATDPYSTNPTRGNEIRTGLANRDQLAHDLSAANEQRWGELLREGTNLKPKAPLNDVETFRALRENAARPAAEISRTGGQMYLTDGQISELQGLRRESTIARPGIEGQMDNLVNRSLDRLGVGDPETFAQGLPAGDMLREIADLRKVARDIYKRKDAGTEEVANADAYLKIANTIEDAVENNLYWQAERNPYGNARKLADDHREGRQMMAKSYVLEDATDMATGIPDPNYIAKVAAKDNALTGVYADVGKIAANFPEASRLNSPVKGMMQTRLYRSSIPGIAGSVIGSMFGPIGAGAGGIVGAGIGEVLGRSTARFLKNPEQQNFGVNPVPRELREFSGDPLAKRFEYGDPQMGREFNRAPDGQPPMLPPPAPPAGPRGPIEGAPAPYRHPNFQFGDNNPQQPRPPGTNVVPGRPLTPEERFAQDKANFAAQDRTQYNREASLDALAMQKAEAEAAALRQPAGEGDVIGGGNNPPVRMEPLVVKPTALQSAVDKIAKGQQFALTAEERIAWSKANGTIETLRSGRKK